MPSAREEWVTFLDGLQAEVKSAHADLDAGRAFNDQLVQPWTPPQHLGALPLSLLDRAQSINDLLNQLQARAEANHEVLRHEITRVRTLNTKVRKVGDQYGESTISMYVDRSV